MVGWSVPRAVTPSTTRETVAALLCPPAVAATADAQRVDREQVQAGEPVDELGHGRHHVGHVDALEQLGQPDEEGDEILEQALELGHERADLPRQVRHELLGLVDERLHHQKRVAGVGQRRLRLEE
jgi:hypothetical protein